MTLDPRDLEPASGPHEVLSILLVCATCVMLYFAIQAGQLGVGALAALFALTMISLPDQEEV